MYGYYIKNELIGFSSEINYAQKLFSYYVGFEKKLNKKYSIYGRMLLETIKNGINQKCDEIVFGRTANEYKSNFGGNTKKIFHLFKNKRKYLKLFHDFFIQKTKETRLKQRHPFKLNNSNA